jgi:glycosyltransferase involved in cell wall biosynthesis
VLAATISIMGRPILFYSAWPLGYHNLEAERKAQTLAQAGYSVTYVAGVGIRNPSVSNLPKLFDRTTRALLARWPGADRKTHGSPPPRSDPSDDSEDLGSPTARNSQTLREGAVAVAPPRQYEAMRRLNSAWLTRQLRRQVSPWDEALAWIRWPTPELVDALPRLRPARVLYEAVDAYEATPGIVGPWVAILARYERRLVELADVVVVPGERLAERYRSWGATVRVIPHGVDLGHWSGRSPTASEPVVVGFVGTLDSRLDIDVLRAIAGAHPEWRVRLIGPMQDGFSAGALADLANVTIEPPVAADTVPLVLGGFDLGVMPYLDHPNTTHMTPVKNLEYMAAGVPAVARRVPALEPYGELLYFASSPDEFVREAERALAEQSAERIAARRALAEGHGWPRRLDEVTALADELTGGP